MVFYLMKRPPAWSLLLAPSLLCSSFAFADGLPVNCMSTGQIVSCEDLAGSHYHVSVVDKHIFIQGYDAATQRTWTQTQAHYGRISFLIGYASDGEIWSGFTRAIGWTSRGRVSSSSTGRQTLLCGRVGGCTSNP